MSQTIAVGRAAERITERGLTGLFATLAYRAGNGPMRRLRTRFHLRSEGYFAFELVPERDMPTLAAEPHVTLRADFERVGAASVAVERIVDGPDLTLDEVERNVGGRTIKVQRIAGAPFDLSLTVDPAAVALAGMVLRDHDPAAPIEGVRVTAGPASAVTDSAGRFLLPALPLLAEVELEIEVGHTLTPHVYRIDYETPVNRVTLSLPS